MHFAKTEKGQTKLSRAFAIVLSLMIIVSMVVVGDVGSISASAATFTITSGTTLYIDLTEVNSWWFNDGGTLKLYWFNESANTEDVYTVATSSNSSGVYSYTFSSDVTCEGLIVRRDITNTETNTEWKNQTVDIKDYNGNCIKVKEQSGKKGYEWKNYTPPITAGTAMTAAIGQSQLPNSEYYDGGNGVKLKAVDAEFYDYFTDYELSNGWRSATDDYDISRKYQQRIPYTKLNKYLADMVGGVEGTWKYPLYFGDFHSEWESYSSFPYGTLYKMDMYDSNMNKYHTSSSHLASQTTIGYTGNEKLWNFSIYANNSGSVAYRNNRNYSGSVQGLMRNTLNNGQLILPNDAVAPYFDDSIVTAGYANKVTTQFLMRVENNNYNGVNYTTYEFNSGAKSSVTSDNVYFTYGADGKTDKIWYGQGSDYELIDAHKDLGGESSNHRGFFPFDNKTSSNIARDYGFGMKLTMDFNLTEDGCILGTNGEKPMEFTFEGDDDVWVYIDDRLILDLGGDHGNAKGSISFKLNDFKSTVNTGAVQLKSDPTYGSTEYLSGGGSSVEKTFDSSILGTTTNKQGKTVYNRTKRHTLTMFYMERGLIESNLDVSFSVSPIEDNLTVEKEVVTTDVNSVVADAVNSAVATEQFDFNVTDSKNGTSYKYNHIGSTETTEAASLESFTLKDGDWRQYIYGFTAGTDPSSVNVTESMNASNKYQYDTKRIVTDVTNNDSVHVAEDEGLSTGAFDFKTSAIGANLPVDLNVKFTNTVKTAPVTLTKKLYESDGTTEVTGDDTGFEISVSQIKLPDGTTISSFANKLTTDTKETGNGVFTLKGGESVTIDKLPVGTEIKFTENSAPTDYMIETGTATVTVNAAGTAEAVIKNKLDAITPAEYTPSVTKHVNGHVLSSDENFFSFTMEEVNSSGNPLSGEHYNVTKTADVSNSKATFTKITFTNSETRYFKITENDLSAAAATAGYTKDNTSFFVKCVATLNGRTVTVDKTFYKGSLNNTDKLTAEEAALVFNNKKNGFLKIVKTDSAGLSNDDLAGTEFTYYKVSGNGAAVPTTGGVKAVVQKNGNAISWVSESSVELGWYAVVETKSATGFELNGEVKYVEVKENDTAADPATVTFKNNKSTELPQTGGIGVVVMIVGGLALIALGVYLLKTDKKDEKSE